MNFQELIILPEQVVKDVVEKHLPSFATMCMSDADLVILHQDAFAADFQLQEFTLLGMAIKYAGLHGKIVQVIGKNRDTIEN